MTEIFTSVGPVLAESAAKATLVLVAALTAAIALRAKSAACRHGLWTAALAGALMVPLLVPVVPGLPVLPVWSHAAPASVPYLSSPDAARTAAAAAAEAPQRVSVAAAAIPPTGVTPTGRARLPEWPLQAWLVVLWAAGATTVLGRYAVGLAAAARLVRRAKPLDDLLWEDRLLDAVGRLDVRVVPPLLVSSATPVPLTCGIRRPALVLPDEARTWDDRRSAVVLLHELAHVRRRDCLVQALVQLACAAYWFHPLIWVAARRLRAERERACDDLVLVAGTPGPDYAEHLLGIARAARHPAPAAAAALAMARVSELEGRLLAILDGTRSRRGVSFRTVVRLAAPATALLALLAAVEPAARATPLPGDPLAVITPEPLARAASPARRAGTAATTGGAQTPVPTPAPSPTPAPATAPAAAAPVAQEGVADAVPAGVIEGLRGALRDPDADVRRHALAALARVDRAVPLDVLATAASDEDANVRAQALMLLGRRRDPEALPALTAAMKDPSEDVRRAAMQALGALRLREAIPTLTGALDDESEDVRESAMFALAQLRATEALPAIVRALEDASPDVREQAAFAVGQFRDPSTVPALMKALKDDNAGVREKVAFALSQIRDRASVPALIGALRDEKGDVREQAAFALGQLGDRAAVEPLIAALTDPVPDVRERAAFALGRLGDPRALEPLTAALKDESADVRQQAAFALSQVAGARPRQEKEEEER